MNKAQLGPHLKFTAVLESKHETGVRHPRRAVLVSISYARGEYEFLSINVYLTQQSSPRPHTERVKEDRLSASIKSNVFGSAPYIIHSPGKFGERRICLTDVTAECFPSKINFSRAKKRDCGSHFLPRRRLIGEANISPVSVKAARKSTSSSHRT